MLAFFTRLPFGKKVVYTEKKFIEGLWTFPFTGSVIGAFLTLPYLIIGIDSAFRGVIVILTYLFLTGGIHLDGLADSCDGLFSNRSKTRVLEIMKDSHIGTFGVIALILYFLCFYVGAIKVAWLWLLMMPFVGKSLGYISAGFSRYARDDIGMGYLFINQITRKHSLIYFTLLIIIIMSTLGIYGLFALCGAILAMLYLMNLTKKVIGGQTGDTVGMTIEISQIAFLLGGVLFS